MEMDADKPKVLLVGPHGDAVLELVRRLLCSLGADAAICSLAEEAVDLAARGEADALIYFDAPDLTGPEAFESVRWCNSGAGFIYVCSASDPHRDRIIEDVRTLLLPVPLTVRQVKTAVASVSAACSRVFKARTAPA
jgi:hypothetical protein